MALQHIRDDGVVLVHVGAVLVAGGDAVARRDGAVHDLERRDERRQDLLDVHAVEVGVVQQALGLEHVDVTHLGQTGVGPHGLLDVGVVVDLYLVGLHVGAAPCQISGCLHAGDAAGLLVVVLVHVGIGRLQHQDDVAGLRIGRVLRAGAGHVDDALLEAHQLARRHDGCAREDEGLALADGLDIAQHPREHLSLTLDLPARLDDILHRYDADALSGHGQVDIQLLTQQRILGYQVEQFLFVDGQCPVRKTGLLPELQMLYKKPMEFQPQNDTPPFQKNRRVTRSAP